MLRHLCLLLATATLLGSATIAEAGRWHKARANFHSTYHRNNCWPEPFVYPDRQAAKAPFETMTANGWRRENLLGKHHFAPGSTQLTRAGELKVRQVVTQAPPRYRTLFVTAARDEETTARRIDLVQEQAVQYLAGGELPDVQSTQIVSEGRPASVVDSLNVRFREAAPTPALPAASSAGGSGSSP